MKGDMAGLTDQQREILAQAGIEPREIESDAANFLQIFEQGNHVFEGATPEDISARASSFIDHLENFIIIIEKYPDSATRAVLGSYIKEEYDVSSGYELNFDRAFADLDAFTKQISLDPKAKAVLDEEVIGSGLMERMGELTERINQSKSLKQEASVEDPQSAFEKTTQKLQEQYTQIEAFQNGDNQGLSRDEMVDVYAEFLKLYDSTIVSNPEDMQVIIKDELDTQLGIAPYVFADKGAHYHGLLAEQIKDYADAAEQIVPADADDPQALLQMYEQQIDLYEKALEASEIKFIIIGYELSFVEDWEHVERLSGYSFVYLEDRLKDAQENKKILLGQEYRSSAESKVEVESSPTSNGGDVSGQAKMVFKANGPSP